MTILFINNEQCTSFEQLQGYFSQEIVYGSDLYWDLVESRHDIIQWICDHADNVEMAQQLRSIDEKMGYSAYLQRMRQVIMGISSENTEPLSPRFSECFAYEGVQYQATEEKIVFSLSLKVLQQVNEPFILKIVTDWGTRATTINSSDSEVGTSMVHEISFTKRPNKEINKFKVYAGEVLLDEQKMKSLSGVLCIELKSTYQRVWGYANGMFVVCKNDKYGFIDESGVEKIPCIFDEVHPFVNNLALVRIKNAGWITIDNEGRIVNTFGKEASNYMDGAVPICKNGYWGLCNLSKKIIVECKYQSIESFADGIFRVHVSGEYESKYMDAKGNLVEQIGKYKQKTKENVFEKLKLNKVSDTQGNVGYLDSQYKVVIPMQFKTIDDVGGGWILASNLDEHKQVLYHP